MSKTQNKRRKKLFDDSDSNEDEDDEDIHNEEDNHSRPKVPIEENKTNKSLLVGGSKGNSETDEA